MSDNPAFYAFTVKDRGRHRQAIWTRIGAAWPHENGKGLNIDLEAYPINGRIVLIEPKPNEADKPAATFEKAAAKEAV